MKLKTLFTALIFGTLLFTSCEENDEVLSATPEPIAEYITTNYPGTQILIIKYDPNDKEFEVKLSNGWELTFDRNYKLTDVDF